jgi:putative spermidine/putrescine transport system ATP-binding protein
MSEPDFLRLDALTLAYGATVAVPSLELSLAEGELVALLGPSGCGKTTTMRSIAGLLAPKSGRIHLAGRDITNVAANKRDVGLVFQSYALFPHLTVFDNVAFGLKVRKLARADIDRRVQQGLSTVGLSGLEGRLPKEISGGQQQRVALARALVVRPRLLLLDEPLSNLDAQLRLEMRSELKRLQRTLGVTMLYVTHDQAEALALADRVVVMRAGRIEQVADPETIYGRPRTGFVARFMGVENIFGLQDERIIGADGASLPLPGSPARVKAVGWRPDGISVGHGPHRARVLGTSFLGAKVEYLLETSIGPVKAETLAGAPRFSAGEAMPIDFPVDTAVFLDSGD